MATLTDTKAKRIKPDDKAFTHGGVAGLTLHPLSVKGWGSYVSPVTQKRRNTGLRRYPAQPAMGVAVVTGHYYTWTNEGAA
ncbi:hypothetical protein [Citrobacter amalonaticus]|uniref:hypothetical protein n=1 Tax=Citrobacter amalonaticus TaxID=35703 RepID=UPI003F54122E